MTRDLSTDLRAEVSKDRLAPILLAELETDGGTVRAWTGFGDLTWGGNVFKGTGAFGGVSSVEEKFGDEVTASGTALTLAGVDPDMISVALGEIRQGLPGKVWFACLDQETGAFVGDPFLLTSGLADVPTIDDSGDSVVVSVALANRLADLERPRVRRFTDQDQRSVYPTDRGFEFVAGLQDAVITWGSGLP